ncbi:hypothetical protein B0H14DRAFT_3600615 [Mycena olivaceomarginata]|nr:hypothetical protein B0H14DRAFT_3600615 [Mycena olivaceomarginata]
MPSQKGRLLRRPDVPILHTRNANTNTTNSSVLDPPQITVPALFASIAVDTDNSQWAQTAHAARTLPPGPPLRRLHRRSLADCQLSPNARRVATSARAPPRPHLGSDPTPHLRACAIEKQWQRSFASIAEWGGVDNLEGIRDSWMTKSATVSSEVASALHLSQNPNAIFCAIPPQPQVRETQCAMQERGGYYESKNTLTDFSQLQCNYTGVPEIPEGYLNVLTHLAAAPTLFSNHTLELHLGIKKEDAQSFRDNDWRRWLNRNIDEEIFLVSAGVAVELMGRCRAESNDCRNVLVSNKAAAMNRRLQMLQKRSFRERSRSGLTACYLSNMVPPRDCRGMRGCNGSPNSLLQPLTNLQTIAASIVAILACTGAILSIARNVNRVLPSRLSTLSHWPSIFPSVVQDLCSEQLRVINTAVHGASVVLDPAASAMKVKLSGSNLTSQASPRFKIEQKSEPGLELWMRDFSAYFFAEVSVFGGRFDPENLPELVSKDDGSYQNKKHHAGDARGIGLTRKK